MKKQLLSFALTAIAVLVLNIMPGFATVWRVNNQAIYDADFTDLAAAVTAANAGDTIHVEASGVAYGAIIIDKKLVLLGPGYFLNSNMGLQNNTTTASIQQITLAVGSAGSIVSGISVALGSTNKIYINDNNILIERCYIYGGIVFQNNDPNVLSNITIKQCYDNNILQGAGYPGPINNLIVSNCYFGALVSVGANGYLNNCQGTFTQCVFNGGINGYSTSVMYINNIIRVGAFTQNNNSASNVMYNLFVTASVPAWLTGGTNFAQPSNVFIASTGSPDYDLQTNPDAVQCPVCYQGGVSGTETLGLFGGSDPYILSGIPNIPSIYLLNAPVTAPAGGTLNVTISTRSNN